MDAVTSCPENVDLPRPPLPASAHDWALLVDIDGTLVGFQSHPRDVRLPGEMTAVLGRLFGQLDGALAVLSGRTLAEVDRLCAPLRLAAGALHGAQHRSPDGGVRTERASTSATELVARECYIAENLWKGVHVENKEGIAYAIHFRGNPAAAEEVRQYAASIAQATEGAFVTQLGNCVAELKPSGPTKGQSLRALLGSLPFAGRRPVAVGDDLTDELAYAEAAALGGFGVVVGPHRPTRASYTLPTPAHTFMWLQALSRAIERSGVATKPDEYQ